MTLVYLPRKSVYKTDGNTLDAATVQAKRVLIIGTAGKGLADQIVIPSSTSVAKSEFGSEGSLLRGMWEAKEGGAAQVALYRIGATAASLTGVGDTTGAAGYTIATVDKDADAGGDYALYYDDTTDRLVIQRNSDSQVVWDNNPGDEIDLFEVNVSGERAAAGGGDIGSPSSFVNLEDVTTTGTTFTAGTDGLDLSKMETYEALYVAYKNLLVGGFDVVVPMDVFLDDYNISAQGHRKGSVPPVLPSANTYPTKDAYSLGSDVDSLGSVYVEEYEGDYYFWWRTSTGAFTAAELYPTGVGSASATLKIDGTALTADDFHEVNFAYQMARFLYEVSTDEVDATGVIGVLPPDSNSLRDKALWLGKEPTWTINSTTGEYTITSSGNNGSGLLGNKFKVGRSDHRSGAFGGGFILTDSEFMDGTEETDENDYPIDLGKYISVVADNPFMRNNWLTSGYIGSFAASYGGFYIDRKPSSSPTNKPIPKSISILYDFKPGDLDKLSKYGYTMLRRKTTGTVVADAPTAALPNSDWRRLSTVRIVKLVIDGVRLAVDKYLGEGTSSSTRASMYTDVEKVLQKAKKSKDLQDYKEFEIKQTPSMEVSGVAQIHLRLVPAFELRVIEVTISVSKSG
jgi:hypothetical protein